MSDIQLFYCMFQPFRVLNQAIYDKTIEHSLQLYAAQNPSNPELRTNIPVRLRQVVFPGFFRLRSGRNETDLYNNHRRYVPWIE